MPEKQSIAVIQEKAVYCDVPPYDPSESYPEYPFKGRPLSQVDNPAYRAVRQAFNALGLDAEHYGSSEWNPLRDVVPAGGTVVIKPNLVMDRHYEGGNIYAVITHPSMIRAVADYCRIALGPSGRIVVADAPVEDCNFAHLREFTKLDEIAGVFKGSGVQFDICDLRRYQSPTGEQGNYAYNRTPLPGDPLGDVRFDLGDQSALCEKPGPFFGSDAAMGETQEHHHDKVHRYCISGTAMTCDTLISMPKLKVHKKVGVTLNLKGMVGINTNKNFLVHYTLGTPRTGGDEAPDLSGAGESTVFWMRRLINKLFFQHHHPVLERFHDVMFHSKAYVALRGLLRKLGVRQSPQVESSYGGNWYGNDSCWRMVADLARIVRYGNKKGTLCSVPQRRLFSVVDGIIGGDRNAPLRPRERPVGIVVAGSNLAAADIVCMRLMGLDHQRLPLYRWLVSRGEQSPFQGLDSIEVISRVPTFRDCLTKPGRYLGFEPQKNWVGHLELPDGQKPEPVGVPPDIAGDTTQNGIRICQMVTSLQTGGMERMVCNLIGGLRKRGVPTSVFCTDEEGELFGRVATDAKSVGTRKAGLCVVDWRLVGEVCRFVRSQRASVIHAHNPVAHLHAVLASFRVGVPVVATWHGQGYTDTWRVLVLKRLLALKTKAVIIVSEDSKRVAVGNGSVPEGRVTVIPNGIDTTVFASGAIPSRGGSDRNDANAPPVVIGSVGRLSSEKNYSLLVRAFARVAKDNKFSLLLVGDGPDRERIEAEIDRLNLKDRCVITGMQGDVVPWLQRMDIFCLSSDTEGLSISLLEAGACGIPSVVTDAGGNREIIEDGVSGLVVPMRDEAALASGIERLAGDAALRKTMGAAARRTVEDRYSLDAMVDRYVKVYEKALR